MRAENPPSITLIKKTTGSPGGFEKTNKKWKPSGVKENKGGHPPDQLPQLTYQILVRNVYTPIRIN
jgi:hypothetical protein